MIMQSEDGAAADRRDDRGMDPIDDAARAALRVYERHPELSVDVLIAAAVGALEIDVPESRLEDVIENVARGFADEVDQDG
jgi:hypothetical protein